MHPIQAECKLTARQYRDYMNHHVLGNRKDLIRHLILSLLIVLFGLINFRTGSPLLGWIFATLGIYVLVSRFLRFYMSVNRIVSEYGLGEEPKFFYAITFDDEGLHVRNVSQKVTYKYEQIHHVCCMENRQMLYLYLTKSNAFLIPYDGLSGATARTLIQTLEEKAGADKLIYG